MSVSSTHANSPVEICSRALIMIGADTITSFDDGSTEALVSVNMYEDIARTALVNTRWRFATNQTQLNLLTNKPTGRYDRAYQLPSDHLMTHAATVDDKLIQYQIYGDKLYADTSASAEVVLDHTFRVNEASWPSYFTIAVEYAMATVFATSIARDSSLANLMSNQANLAMTKARTLDSQQQTTRKLSTSRFITNRRS